MLLYNNNKLTTMNSTLKNITLLKIMKIMIMDSEHKMKIINVTITNKAEYNDNKYYGNYFLTHK